jgi:uncharacterized membrane protein YfcA
LIEALSGAVAWLAAGFSQLSVTQLAVVAVAAFASGVMTTLAGYGIGLIMPLVLVPLVGVHPVVPIAALAGLFLNLSRVALFFHYANLKRAATSALFAAPTCALGAYGFTRLTGKGILLVLGSMLVLSVPLRYLLKHLQMKLGDRGLLAGSFLYGAIFGVTPGAGVIMVAMLMAAGVQGTAVLATDALVSFALVAVKASVFVVTGVITPVVLALALVTGIAVLPATFVGRMIMLRMPLHIHTAMLDVAVVGGGAMLFYYGLRAT